MSRSASRRSASRASVACLTSSSMRAMRLIEASPGSCRRGCASGGGRPSGRRPRPRSRRRGSHRGRPRARLRDEVQHPLRLVGRKLADLAERRHVPLGQDEQVRVGPGVDVADRDEAVALGNVVTFLHELAEEAVLRQRGSLPPRRPHREPGRARRPRPFRRATASSRPRSRGRADQRGRRHLRRSSHASARDTPLPTPRAGGRSGPS